MFENLYYIRLAVAFAENYSTVILPDFPKFILLPGIWAVPGQIKQRVHHDPSDLAVILHTGFPPSRRMFL